MTIQAGANKTDTITTTAVATFAPTALVTDIATLDADLIAVATALSSIGADASSIDRAMDGAMAMEDGQRAAYSRSMDADFARATMNMTSAQVIQQAGVAALSQANSIPQMALGLLR